MNKMMMIVAACAAIVFTGCKSIEVDRRGQQLAIDQNGQVVKTASGEPLVLDMGWNVDYFQHWNWQRFDALEATAGSAALKINNYQSGADTNLAALVSASFDGGVKLCNAIGEAYAKIAGGKAQADTVLSTGKRIYDFFVESGGNADNATVSTTSDNKVQVSDGATCVQCDSAGKCTDCSHNPN